MCGRFQYGCSRIARQTSHLWCSILWIIYPNSLGYLLPKSSTRKLLHTILTSTQQEKNLNSLPLVPAPKANFYKCHVTGFDLGYTSLGHGHDTPSFSWLLQWTHETDGWKDKSDLYTNTPPNLVWGGKDHGHVVHYTPVTVSLLPKCRTKWWCFQKNYIL